MQPAHPASESPEIVDEAFVLQILRDMVNRVILQKEPLAEEAENELEPRMESLWDLSVDGTLAAFTVNYHVVSVLSKLIVKNAAEGRIAEISIGILANIFSHQAVVETISTDERSCSVSAVLQALSSHDVLVVIQALRAMCAILFCPSQHAWPSLWTEESCKNCLFIVENSLHWEAVQLACDVMSQVLKLESERVAQVAAGDNTGQKVSQNSTAWCSFVQTKFPHVWAQRVSDIVRSCAGEEADGSGDPEIAALSALRLAENFMSSIGCTEDETFLFGSSVLQVLQHLNNPDAVVAALELLSSCMEQLAHLLPMNEASVATSPPGSMKRLAEKMASCMADVTYIEDKLTFVLDDCMDESVAVAALALLQHVPWGRIKHHHSELADAAKLLTSPSPYINARFLLQLTCTPEDNHE